MGRKAKERKATEVGLPVGAVRCEPELLADVNSYGRPDFAERGYYVDLPFTCATCGEHEVWSAAQQKWWYEVAKGFWYSTAKHCAACRHAEHARVEEARRVSLAGLAAKAARPAPPPKRPKRPKLTTPTKPAKPT